MKRLVGIVLVASSVFVSGCFAYTLHTGARGDGVARSGRGSVFAWGLVGKKLDSQCPEGLAYARTYQPWWSGIVSALTIGIVTPWRATYECAVPRSAAAAAAAPVPAPLPTPGGMPPNPIGEPAAPPLAD